MEQINIRYFILILSISYMKKLNFITITLCLVLISIQLGLGQGKVFHI